MEATESDIDYATRVLKACVEHGRSLLALRLREIEARNYDVEPHFHKMITELFLVGIMWRFGEQFDLPTNARDRAFVSLMQEETRSQACVYALAGDCVQSQKERLTRERKYLVKGRSAGDARLIVAVTKFGHTG